MRAGLSAGYEPAYKQAALLHKSANRPVPTTLRGDEEVRGNACENGFHVDACRNGVPDEGFNLVILSSPARVISFQQVFDARSWSVGRYHIFELTADGPGKKEISSQ